jgi:hypothetical protein
MIMTAMCVVPPSSKGEKISSPTRRRSQIGEKNRRSFGKEELGFQAGDILPSGSLRWRVLGLLTSSGLGRSLG